VDVHFPQRHAVVLTGIPALYALFTALICILYDNEYEIEKNDKSAAGHSQIHAVSLSLMRTIE
jgi:hypothetical protein